MADEEVLFWLFVFVALCLISYTCKQRYGATSRLFVAVDRGDLDLVKYLLEQGTNVNARNSLQYTALMRAAEKGDLEMVKLLVRKGADVNKKDRNGTTALTLAARNRHNGIVVVLIAHGAE